MKSISSNPYQFVIHLAILGVAATAALAQNTVSIDPIKAYSTVGLIAGETLRVGVVNIGGTQGLPPDPCSVQMGFVNAGGVLLKTSNTNIGPGHTAFLTLSFQEASAALAAGDSRTRVNVRAIISTLAPPCRSISSAQLYSALGRARDNILPAVQFTNAPPDPEFGVTGITPFDTLRLNVTNVTGSNGIPPGPCTVQMGFVNASGDVVRMTGGTIDPGRTASVAINYFEAAGAFPSALAFTRLDLRPLVTIPPDPCHVASSSELVDSVSGETLLYVPPAEAPPLPAPVMLAQ